jgi:hypothetical protein
MAKRELEPGEATETSLDRVLPAVSGKRISIVRDAEVNPEIAEIMRELFTTHNASVTLAKANDDDLAVWLRTVSGRVVFQVAPGRQPSQTKEIAYIEWPSVQRGPSQTYSRTRIARDAALQGAYHTAVFARDLFDGSRR